MKKYVAILSIIFTAGIVAGFWYYEKSEKVIIKNEKIPYFKDIKIDRLKLNGIEDNFSLREGKVYKDSVELLNKNEEHERVIKLALFYQTLKESPLLFDPNLEAAEFSKSVNEMKLQNEIFNKKTNAGYVNPVLFLESFAAASEQFHVFENEISEDSAIRFLAAIKDVQGKYINEAQRIANIFNSAISEGNNGDTLAFLAQDTFSNFRIMSEDLHKIIRNGELLAEEIKKREQCLKYGQCKRLKKEKPKLDDNALSINLKILNPEEMHLRDEIIEGGPYVIHSNCWRDRNINLMLEAKKCLSKNNYCIDWPLLSDGEYYVKTVNDKRESLLVEKGIERRLQSASAPYGCMDLTYKPKLRTMDFAMQNYKENRFFLNSRPVIEESLKNELDLLWKDGRKSEDMFFEAKYPSDNALNDMIDYYEYAYGFFLEKDVDSQLMSDLLIRINSLKGQMKKFDIVLNRSTYHFNRYLLDNLENDLNGQVENIYAIRSNYSLTFLTFSPFVWISKENLQFTLKNRNDFYTTKKDPRELPVLNFEEAVSIYGKDVLDEWFKFANENLSYN